jgi:hypothetical protein
VRSKRDGDTVVVAINPGWLSFVFWVYVSIPRRRGGIEAIGVSTRPGRVDEEKLGSLSAWLQSITERRRRPYIFIC